MILGIEDIAGGNAIVAFLTWLGLTGLFYLVCFMAALNVVDNLTRNHLVKLPVMLAVSVPVASIMAIFNYNPNILFLLMLASNYFRLKNLSPPKPNRLGGITIKKPLFYTASYLYIVAVFLLASYLIYPVEVEGQSVPYWKTLLPAE